jgi:DNA invertase Pin-like site-specific DNA recombinase
MRHGWELGQVVHDIQPPPRRHGDRPGLRYVLGQIAAGEAVGLVCVQLSDLADTVAELAALLERFVDRDAFLVALDHDRDTTTTGRVATRALLQAGRWEQHRDEPGSRHTLAAVSPQAAARDDPALRARIARMQAAGMSLQAIADTLNHERVPTIHDDSHWRPSSVQAATGYTRPPNRGNGGRR